MKILFIVPLPPPVHGSSMMSMYIRDSKLINKNAKCDYINLSTSRSLDEIQKFSIKKIFRFLHSYYKTLKCLITQKYDVCYLATSCFGIPFLKDAPFIIMCKFFTNNVVIHFHNKGMKNYAHRAFYKMMFNWVYKKTTIVLLSELLYEDVKDVIKKDQIKICSNGIPEISSTIIDKNNSIPHILFLSNLIISKGVLCLLDACKILKEKNHYFICNLIGGETKEINCERINQEIKDRGLENQVFYKGRAYGKDKEKIYNESDIFVFPTYYPQECFPVVLLEAMQHKLPCISSFEGAIPEIIKNEYNGFLCNPHNINELAEKLEKLIIDKNLRLQMGNNGFEIYNNKYKVTNFESNIYKILNQ